jgi:acyl-CoA synthetase (AMP-forming)/AMP-acid ligase II
MADLTTYNFADIWEAIADEVAGRVAIVSGDRRLTFAQVEERSNRLAHHLASVGVGPDDHVGMYLTNGYEYVEGMLACWKLRAVPINVNYRYVADELRYLFDNAALVAVLHGAEFADRVDAVLPDVPSVRATLATGDPYEAALAAASPERDFGPRSNDDRYVIYTGGTTGMPKGVVWRHEDAFFACLGGGDPMRSAGPTGQPAELIDRIIQFDFCAYPLAPLMHAAAAWTGLGWLFCGGRIVLNPGSFDPLEVWETIGRESVNTVIMVGDAMARPLADTWDSDGPFEIGSLFAIGSGGAPLSAHMKDRFVAMLPNVVISDGFGSSETGAQGVERVGVGQEAGAVGRFETLGGGTTVLADDLSEVMAGSGVVGRVARSGHVPLGYYNDPERTAEMFVEVAGRRWVLTGDMATVDSGGNIELFGRGSVSINTGGEKVYPEEVEGVLKSHPAVYDAVVVGVPDDRWGEHVCAVVQPASGDRPTLDQLAEHCRAKLAGYKVPRQLVLVDQVVRSPVGKADYPWAKAIAEADTA